MIRILFLMLEHLSSLKVDGQDRIVALLSEVVTLIVTEKVDQ